MSETHIPTNEEIINHAVSDLARRKNEINASSDFLAGFFAALDFMHPDFDEAQLGSPYHYLENAWSGYAEARTDISLQAKFKQMNTTDGATKLVFELHAKYLNLMPTLIPLNGNNVFLALSDPQQRLELIDAQGKEADEELNSEYLPEELPFEGVIEPCFPEEIKTGEDHE